jgi:hypothetical protein
VMCATELVVFGRNHKTGEQLVFVSDALSWIRGLIADGLLKNKSFLVGTCVWPTHSLDLSVAPSNQAGRKPCHHPRFAFSFIAHRVRFQGTVTSKQSESLKKESPWWLAACVLL